jgi:hypothetical protein
MKVELVPDEFKKHIKYNRSDAYAKEFEGLGGEIVFLDFKRMDWLKQIEIRKPDLIMWRE